MPYLSANIQNTYNYIYITSYININYPIPKPTIPNNVLNNNPIYLIPIKPKHLQA